MATGPYADDFAAARRAIDARADNFVNPSALDRLYGFDALIRQARQPRADYTIDQLPLLGSPPTSAEVPVWYNGLTWKSTVLALQAAEQSGTVATGIFIPENYGALGNGIADDSNAIANCYAAAYAFTQTAPDNNACVVFQPVRYGYAGINPIQPQPNVGTFAYPGAEINRLSTSTDCFLFSNTQEIGGTFPAVVNFTTGAAFHFLNSSYCRIAIGGTNNCLYGVLFDAANGTCNYNVVNCGGEISGNDFSSAGQTNYGVAFRALVSSDNCSANTANVAALFESYACVAFLTTAVSPITAGMAGNTVTAGILTSLGLSTPQNGNYGVFCGPNIAPTANTIVANFIGYNTTADVFWTSLATNNIVKAYIQVAGSLTYAKYAMGGYGNVIQLNNPGYSQSSVIPLSATSNVRASWNSGTAVGATSIPFSITASAMTSQASVTWYGYSPFLNGQSIISVQVLNVSGVAAGAVIVQTAVDNSGTHANEFGVLITNLTGSAWTGTLTGVVKIGP